MKLQVRGDSIKIDAEARQLMIKALNAAAEGWLEVAADQGKPEDRTDILAEVGNVKAFAHLLEPKAED